MNKLKGKVVLIVGPTGAGKTDLAIRLAKRIDGEIISADSRYLYRGMDLGTAKPGIEEMNTVPHHLVNVANPDETWSLANFIDSTMALIAEIHSRDRNVIVVGGSGQYFRALTEGWQIPELVPNPQLRQSLETWSTEIGGIALHDRLSLLDPEAASMIDPSNVRRTIRALEVILSTGRRFSELRTKTSPAYAYHVIGLSLPREVLYPRLDQRIEEMFERGLVEEVRALLDSGYPPILPSMSAIGYQEVNRYLSGEISIEAAKMLMKKRTRNLVRRQANWFKPTDAMIRWYEAKPDPLEKVISDLVLGE